MRNQTHKSIVFVWDNFGPTHADRADAVALAIAPLRVLGIELNRTSSEYEWISVGGEKVGGFEKITLSETRTPWPLSAFRIIKEALRSDPMAVFSCHYERPEIFFSSLVLRLLGVPVFMMMDSKFDDFRRNLAKELIKTIFFLPYSGALVASIRSLDYVSFFGIAPDKVRLGYDAVSVARIRRQSNTLPAPEGAAFEARHFTIVARLIPKKNLSLAIRAFAEARRNGCRRDLVICGSGPLHDQLQGLAKELDVADHVIFRGFVQTDEVAQVLGSTLALVHPSLEEQFGIAIAEAVAMGVPVLAAQNCGARDTLLRTAVNGFVFEPDNVGGLAALMAEIDKSQDLWQKLARGCSQFADEADTGVFVDSVMQLAGIGRRPSPGKLAPIAIFAFRRPHHLARCLDALELCPEFERSEVFIFIDGPRDDSERVDVEHVVDLVKKRARPNMTIVARESNLGLARSIIQAVSRLVESHGRVIVIEDDLIVQPAALSWLNSGLNAFTDDANVMQISAYQYNIPEFQKRRVGSFQQFSTTWGWGTWKRAWDLFDPTAKDWEIVAPLGAERSRFDRYNAYPFSDMLIKQMCGELDSWGIRWSWSMYRANALTLMPPRSLVQNVGFDGSATHNSVGWLKQLIMGPQPTLWKEPDPPELPMSVEVPHADDVAFRRGLKRTGAMRNARIKELLSILGMSVASARIQRRMNSVIALAQLPPPTTGLSNVNKAIVSELATAKMLFASWDLSPGAQLRGPAKAAIRLGKTISYALALLSSVNRRARSVYIPCDGGLGQIYNIFLIAAARLGGYDVWLHHHSFSYITRTSLLMTTLMAVAPRKTHHIFLCTRMGDLFDRRYGLSGGRRDHLRHTLSNAFTVPSSDGPPIPRNGNLRIGHLSNLTEEKGSVRFLALFERLIAAGVPVVAEIAGPIHDKATEVAIRKAQIDYPDRFKWHGPLSGKDKTAFYQRLDAFVFPTHYCNEAQPLVLLEAMACGAAILATTRGCIGCDHVDKPGLVCSEEDFETSAFNWLAGLGVDDRQAMPGLVQAAFSSAREEARGQLTRIFESLSSDAEASTLAVP